MLRSILIGLDGSVYSRTAVELGLRWARQSDAILVGLSVLDEQTIRHPEMVPLGGMAFKEHRDEVLLADARRKVEEFRAAFVGQCAAAGVRCQVLEDTGLPAEQIILEAQRYDLILLGQQTYFHFETERSPDDTLRRVLRSSPRPVVSVPEKLPEGRAVVVAYDSSLQAARTLQVFQAVGWTGAAEVHVVSVAAEAEVAQQHAERGHAFLRHHDVPAEAHALVSAEPPARVILEQVRQRNAGLLVMGAYGHSALREFFFGSVTQAMLRECPVPLFLYH